jgi:hypothetical protein
MQNGIISYRQTLEADRHNSKDINFRKVENWISTNSSLFQLKITNKDKNRETITGTVLFRVDIPQTGNYFWLRARINFQIGKDSIRIQVRDFYEKPIEKGVTNDYSKIEYRWWDFKNAKPWSSEDETLFKGLDDETRKLLDSFAKWMGSVE